MKADRFAKLTEMGAQAPLMPLVGQLSRPEPDRVLVARLSASMMPTEVDRIEAMAREHARSTGDKPTQSEMIRAGLELLSAMPLADRQAVLERLPKIKRGGRRS